MGNPLYDTLLARHAGSAAPFLIAGDGGETSYEQFLAQAAQMAHALTAFGVRPGDRVAVQVEKSPEALALYAACLAAGAVFLPLNTAYTPAEVSYFVSDAEPALLVCDPAACGALQLVAASCGCSSSI